MKQMFLVVKIYLISIVLISQAFAAATSIQHNKFLFSSGNGVEDAMPDGSIVEEVPESIPFNKYFEYLVTQNIADTENIPGTMNFLISGDLISGKSFGTGVYTGYIEKYEGGRGLDDDLTRTLGRSDSIFTDIQSGETFFGSSIWVQYNTDSLAAEISAYKNVDYSLNPVNNINLGIQMEGGDLVARSLLVDDDNNRVFMTANFDDSTCGPSEMMSIDDNCFPAASKSSALELYGGVSADNIFGKLGSMSAYAQKSDTKYCLFTTRGNATYDDDKIRLTDSSTRCTATSIGGTDQSNSANFYGGSSGKDIDSHIFIPYTGNWGNMMENNYIATQYNNTDDGQAPDQNAMYSYAPMYRGGAMGTTITSKQVDILNGSYILNMLDDDFTGGSASTDYYEPSSDDPGIVFSQLTIDNTDAQGNGEFENSVCMKTRWISKSSNAQYQDLFYPNFNTDSGSDTVESLLYNSYSYTITANRDSSYNAMLTYTNSTAIKATSANVIQAASVTGTSDIDSFSAAACFDFNGNAERSATLTNIMAIDFDSAKRYYFYNYLYIVPESEAVAEYIETINETVAFEITNGKTIIIQLPVEDFDIDSPSASAPATSIEFPTLNYDLWRDT